jgi:hypothetical protein
LDVVIEFVSELVVDRLGILLLVSVKKLGDLGVELLFGSVDDLRFAVVENFEEFGLDLLVGTVDNLKLGVAEEVKVLVFVLV